MPYFTSDSFPCTRVRWFFPSLLRTTLVAHASPPARRGRRGIQTLQHYEALKPSEVFWGEGTARLTLPCRCVPRLSPIDWTRQTSQHHSNSFFSCCVVWRAAVRKQQWGLFGFPGRYTPSKALSCSDRPESGRRPGENDRWTLIASSVVFDIQGSVASNSLPPLNTQCRRGENRPLRISALLFLRHT